MPGVAGDDAHAQSAAIAVPQAGAPKHTLAAAAATPFTHASEARDVYGAAPASSGSSGVHANNEQRTSATAPSTLVAPVAINNAEAPTSAKRSFADFSLSSAVEDIDEVGGNAAERPAPTPAAAAVLTAPSLKRARGPDSSGLAQDERGILSGSDSVNDLLQAVGAKPVADDQDDSKNSESGGRPPVTSHLAATGADGVVDVGHQHGIEVEGHDRDDDYDEVDSDDGRPDVISASSDSETETETEPENGRGRS
jgi:hypothetical protein